MARTPITVMGLLLLCFWAASTEAELMKYKDPKQPLNVRIGDLISRMTLEEKIGQMVQIDRSVASAEVMKKYFIGSVLSGGGSVPVKEASAETWIDMVNDFQKGSLSTRLGIPMIYGIDAVHGHNNVYKATVFPHNVGLGATRDPELVKRIGAATALEVRATGIPYVFAPCIAVCRDPRWGRCYESYSEDPKVVSAMTEIVAGLQGDIPTNSRKGVPFVAGKNKVAACAKHYVGDGGTTKGINENNTVIDRHGLLSIHMPGYFHSIIKGVSTVMISYSSWNGIKMHSNYELITGFLKHTLRFRGFVISDWQGIDRITTPVHANYSYSIQTGIHAGIDMIMVPYNYTEFIDGLTFQVKNKIIPMSRIDDAVKRILRVKFMMGLFEDPLADYSLVNQLGSQEHRELAREAVRRSLVLLKNGESADEPLLPLAKKASKILVAGSHANNLGNQCGGWTIEWQGLSGNNLTKGTTILKAIKNTVDPKTDVVYEENPDSDYVKSSKFSYAIVVVGEPPYAETFGDSLNLTLPESGLSTVTNVCGAVKCVVVIISGRPVVIQPYVSLVDALVAAWLPGTEGQGVADVLFGDYGFTGKLPRTWFKTVDQLPMNVGDAHYDPLFPFGFGLTTKPIAMSQENRVAESTIFHKIPRSSNTVDSALPFCPKELTFRFPRPLHSLPVWEASDDVPLLALKKPERRFVKRLHVKKKIPSRVDAKISTSIKKRGCLKVDGVLGKEAETGLNMPHLRHENHNCDSSQGYGQRPHSPLPVKLSLAFCSTNWNEKDYFWYDLESIGNSFAGPWFCLRDFNALVSQADKYGGRPVSASSSCGFQAFMLNSVSWMWALSVAQGDRLEKPMAPSSPLIPAKRGLVDADDVPLLALKKQFCGEKTGNLWYCFDDEEWVALRSLKNDKDVVNLINRSFVEKRSILNIYVEHAVDEAVLVETAEPLLQLTGPVPSQTQSDVPEAPIDDAADGGTVGDLEGGENIAEDLSVDEDLGVDEDFGVEEDVNVNQELGGDDLSGFSGTDVEESNLFSDVESPVNGRAETSSNVDWFGVFPANVGEDDDGPSSEYEDSDGKRSHDGSDSEQPPLQNLQPEFNEETDMLGEGLGLTFDEEMPEVEHRCCLRHLHANLKGAGFKGKAFKDKLWAAATATNIVDFKAAMLKIEVSYNGPESWPMGSSNVILPPVVRVQPGRPKKARKRAPDEPNLPYKVSGRGYLVRCGNCGTEGHNARSCPHPENPNKKVWKKKAKKVPGDTTQPSRQNRGRRRGRGRGRGTMAPDAEE
ncbi:Beta-glucosidase BoGH3B [Morella rubra]|uniref:Beta-glucosidase BoGH3B n=1 Tax=Morella rubra TaxID=262757 RepID=A0A6A1UKC0_9ROSI|nr:Beta-glucosidase BoGH3B [Morella rubra]